MISHPSLSDFGTHDESRFPELWEGCVGAWAPCLGPTGLRLHDHSRFGNWGALTNMDAATDWLVSSGKFALDFDGSNDLVEIPFRFNSTGAIAFWYRGSTEPGTAIYLGNKLTIGTEVYLGQPVTGSLTNELITFSNDVGANSRIFAYTSATRTELFDNNWHHVAIVLRQENTAPEIYLDGILRTVSSGSASLASWSIGNAAATTLQIGAQNFSGNSFFLTGQLDDIRIYNRPPNQANIKLLATYRGVAYQRRLRKSYFASQIGPTFRAAWARNSNYIISPVGAA